MATTVSFNGTNYSIPDNREPKGWGTNLSAFLVAVGQNALAKSGGTFTLTADANFGSNYGLVVKYIKSVSANIAQSGVIRFANDEGLAWRNAANSADLALKVNSSNNLEYATNKVLDSTDILDEDTMASDSASKVPSQQSTKAYVDTGLALKQNSSNAVTTDGNQTITGIKSFNEELLLKEQATPSTPSATYHAFYPKSDGKLYKLDSSGNEVEVGSGAGGGSLNLILNPDGDTDLDSGATNDIGDWIDSGAGTTSSKTTTAGEIPLEDLKSNAIKIVLASGTNDYTRIRFQVPPGYRNTNLGISWTQRVSGLSAENMKVELYNYSDAYASDEAEVALFSDDTSGDTFIAANNGLFKTTFSANSREYYELRFINNGGTSGYLSLNEVTVDKRSAGVSGLITRWEVSTATITNVSASTVTSYQRQVGENLELAINYSGSLSVSGTMAISLPSGLTFNSSIIGYPTPVGTCWGLDSGTTYRAGVVANVGGALSLTSDDDNGPWQATVPMNWVSSDRIGARVSIPITEWEGMGTVYLLNRSIVQSNIRLKATRTTSAQSLTNGSYTEISWNNTVYSKGDIDFDGVTVTFNVAGYYRIFSRGQIDGTVSSANTAWGIWDDGDTTQYSGSHMNQRASPYVSVEYEGYFEIGDTVKVRAFVSDASLSFRNDNTSSFTVHRIAMVSASDDFAIGTSDNADTSDKYLLPIVKESAEGDLGTITNWASPGSKKYRWVRTGNKIEFWFYITARNSGSASSSAASFGFPLPTDIPNPENHLSTININNEFGIPISLIAGNSGSAKGVVNVTSGTWNVTIYLSASATIDYLAGYSTWMIDP